MKHLLSLLFLLFFSWPMIHAQSLKEVVERGEYCYQIDDYYGVLGAANILDSLFLRDPHTPDVEAYYHKLMGDYHYGTDIESFFCVSSSTYEHLTLSRIIFAQCKMLEETAVVDEELSHYFYKVAEYDSCLVHLALAEPYYYERMFDADVLDYELDRYYNLLSQKAMALVRKAVMDYQYNEKPVEPSVIESSQQWLDTALSYFQHKKKHPLYAETLRKKAKTLMLLGDATHQDNRLSALSYYRRFVMHQLTLASTQLSSLSAEQREQHWLEDYRFLGDAFRLGNAASDMLYDLTLRGKGALLEMERTGKMPHLRWKNIRDVLKNTDCAIEFVQYHGAFDKKRMGCLVLRKDFKTPQFIDLFSVDSLEEMEVSHWLTLYEAIYDTSKYKDALYNCESLKTAIWTPELMKAIGDAKRVYFSPDGLFHLLAIEYLAVDNQKDYYRLSSTRRLTEKRKETKLTKALIVGGIDFYSDVTYPSSSANDESAYQILKSVGAYFPQLHATTTEINDIRTIRNVPQDQYLLDKDATDEQFIEKVNEQTFNLIHLSTHGYYLHQLFSSTDVKPAQRDNALSESGIVFAGASKNLLDDTFNPQLPDGILSALEIKKSVPLQDTELVILSACSTARGRITADGVFGLQRALKHQGAKGLLVTLWSVSDVGTEQLMAAFYRALQKQSKKDIHAALKAAREELRLYPQMIKMFNPETLTFDRMFVSLDNPSYINPFILIDVF